MNSEREVYNDLVTLDGKDLWVEAVVEFCIREKKTSTLRGTLVRNEVESAEVTELTVYDEAGAPMGLTPELKERIEQKVISFVCY